MAHLAAENYMYAGLDPALQALTTGNPRQFLSQASVITELDQSSGDLVGILGSEQDQALRDKQTAAQQLAAVEVLQGQMNAKRQAIDSKIDQVNGAAMKQAMAIFDQTGQYPDITIPTANTVGAQALQAALQSCGDLHRGRADGRRPDFGEVVRVDPVYRADYDGAVRIG